MSRIPWTKSACRWARARKSNDPRFAWRGDDQDHRNFRKAIALTSLYWYVPWASQARVRVHVAHECGSTHPLLDKTTPLL
jgi:hypothetical protein